jgi:hypothetical protein
MLSLGSMGMYMMVRRSSNIACHTPLSLIFSINVSAKPLKSAMCKGKWAFDPCLTQS